MTRPAAEERLGRLLAIVPWIAARDGPSIAEVCRRFNVTERQLLADLDLLFLCGVYPFTPDVLIEVDIADDRVWIRFADYFRRPLRLTPPEGLALISAGSALLRVPGLISQDSVQDGALARALEKLAAVLGVGSDSDLADTGVDVELAPVAPEILEIVQRATAEHRQVELDYYSFGRDDRSTRIVEPWQVFNAHGQWYLTGFCHQAGGERLFRVDRISRARLLEEAFQPPRAPAGQSADLFHRDPDDEVVVLDLAPAARWIAEQYPNEGVTEMAGGRLRVTLRVSEKAWLERLLLRAGPAATLVEGDPAIRTKAAKRVLSRYRSSSVGSVW
ncbi:MAG TPA: WYL domain-containing protein [Acidimicrobiales bacterium]